MIIVVNENGIVKMPREFKSTNDYTAEQIKEAFPCEHFDIIQIPNNVYYYSIDETNNKVWYKIEDGLYYIEVGESK